MLATRCSFQACIRTLWRQYLEAPIGQGPGIQLADEAYRYDLPLRQGTARTEKDWTYLYANQTDAC